MARPSPVLGDDQDDDDHERANGTLVMRVQVHDGRPETEATWCGS